MDKIKKISIIGAGSWGTALAVLLAEKDYSIKLWCRRKELAEEINKNEENKQYLKNIKISNKVTATSSIEDSSKNADLIVFCVPSDFLRDTAKAFSKFIKKGTIVMHTAKGIEASTGKLMSKVLEEELNVNDVAVLSGPNHAEEVANKLPTATVIACKNEGISKSLCNLFKTEYFKPYAHDDPVGVEICGAVKNIIAIALGVCDGLNFGDNAKASILTLGLSEMSLIAHKFGAKRMTCYGLAGVGDLVVTCYSSHSRNRFVGEMLSKGKNIENIKNEMHGMVAEGIKNTKTIHDICRKINVEAPLITQTYSVLYQGVNLKKAIKELLNTV